MASTSEFSRTLSLLRQERGVSQRTAASDLGISQATAARKVAKYVYGRTEERQRDMSLVTLKAELRQELKLTPQLLQSMQVLQMNSQELLEYLGKLSE